MNKQNFIKLIEHFKTALNNSDKYYKLGIYLNEIKNSPLEPLHYVIDLLMYEAFTEKQADLIYWFMYENDFGKDGLTYNDFEIKTTEELYNIINEL